MESRKKARDLIAIYKDSEDIKKGIERLNLITTHPKFKVGQAITFWGGYNNDILFKSVITGFDNDGEIYVLWDCFWSPIRDDDKRKIQLQ